MSGASAVSVNEEAPVARRIDATTVLRLGALVLTERGPIGTPTLVTSMVDFKAKFGGYTANNVHSVAAVQGFFDNGGTQLYVGRVVHMTDPTDPSTKTSAAATLDLLTASAAATAGYTESAAEPFVIADGDTLVVAFEAGGDQTFTFDANAAVRQSADGPFDLNNGQTLVITVGAVTNTWTVVSSEYSNVDAATAAEVRNSLNAFFAANGMAAVASVASAKVVITTNQKGDGALINIASGTANTALGFTTGALNGVGNVADSNAVTAAEVVAMASGITNGTATVVAGKVRFTSATTGGSSTAQVKASSTADDNLGFDNAVHTGLAGTAVATLTVDGKTDGTYAHGIQIQVTTASNGDTDRVDINVLVNGNVRERWPNLSWTTTDARYVESVINNAQTGSNLITVSDQLAAVPSPGNLPATGTSGYMSGGNDGLSGLVDADYIGGVTGNTYAGLRVFDTVETLDVLIAPGRATSAVHNAMITYAEVTRSGLCFCVFDPPAATDAEGMVTYMKSTASLYQASEYFAMYWPRVKVSNPSRALYGTDATITIPPSGHIAGMMARVDAAKIGGVFDHPAGSDPLYLLRNVIGLETNEVTITTRRGLVFDALVNPITTENGGPVKVDGARTGRDVGNFPAVGMRRGAIFIAKRLIVGLEFVRHRGIKPELLNQAARTAQDFLTSLTGAGAFSSLEPSRAFFVDFGGGLNNAATAKTHTVYGRVGVALAEPAEYVVILLSPFTAAQDTDLAVLAAAA